MEDIQNIGFVHEYTSKGPAPEGPAVKLETVEEQGADAGEFETEQND